MASVCSVPPLIENLMNAVQNRKPGSPGTMAAWDTCNQIMSSIMNDIAAIATPHVGWCILRWSENQ